MEFWARLELSQVPIRAQVFQTAAPGSRGFLWGRARLQGVGRERKHQPDRLRYGPPCSEGSPNPGPATETPNDSIVDRGDLHFAQNRLRYGRVRICGGSVPRFRGENDARRRASRRRNLGLFGIVMSRLDHRNEKEHHVVNRMQIRGHVRRFA